MRVHVRTLQGNFLNIATRAADQIHEKNVDVQSFRRRFMMQMNVSQRYEYQQFLKCCLMKLEPGTTTDDLLCHLSMYWDFLNYGLLEHTVNIFGDAPLQKDMEDYIDNLKTFRMNTKLCDFIDNWPVQGQDPPKADFKHFVIKMKKNWEECTLEDIEKFKGTLTRKFFVPGFALLLREANKGCVSITWYTPAAIAKTLRENLPNIEIKFFKTHGILQVSISGQELHFCSRDPEFGHYSGGADLQHGTRFKHVFDKLLRFSIVSLLLVVVLIEIVLSVSEKHETVHIRDSNVSDKTNRYYNKLKCPLAYDFVWMSFISFTFISSIVSLEWHVFRTMNEELTIRELLYTTIFAVVVESILVVVVLYHFLFGILTIYTTLLLCMYTIEYGVYFIVFYILKRYCKQEWWWKHCTAILYIVSILCIIALGCILQRYVFITFIVFVLLSGGVSSLLKLWFCRCCPVVIEVYWRLHFFVHFILFSC